jgi:hypothetical protein
MCNAIKFEPLFQWIFDSQAKKIALQKNNL